MRIRDDLEGVVHVAGVVLAAGDTIPDGVEVGEHLTGQDATEEVDNGTRRRGGRRSSTRAHSDD